MGGQSCFPSLGLMRGRRQTYSYGRIFLLPSLGLMRGGGGRQTIGGQFCFLALVQQFYLLAIPLDEGEKALYEKITCYPSSPSPLSLLEGGGRLWWRGGSWRRRRLSRPGMTSASAPKIHRFNQRSLEMTAIFFLVVGLNNSEPYEHEIKQKLKQKLLVYQNVYKYVIQVFLTIKIQV